MHYGENGILRGAKTAVDKYQNKAEQEQNELAKVDDSFQYYLSSNRDDEGYNFEDNGKIITTNSKYNGKSIKKVCLTGQLTSGQMKFLDLSAYNIDKILDISGYAIVDQGKVIARVGCHYTDVAYIDFYYQYSSCYLWETVGTQYNGSTVYLFITYTENN